MNRSLQGRVAIVTGAGRNIRAGCRALAADGAAVVVNYPDADGAAEATQVADRIVATGGSPWRSVPTSARAAVQAMVAEAAQSSSQPDILVNNAAISVAAQAPWHELSGEAWNHVLQVNVTGAFLCARALIPRCWHEGAVTSSTCPR